MPDVSPRHDSHHSPRRVLVADADADTRSLYREALSRAGCEVVEASDGRDALAKALVRQPALVIVELRLPLMDGIVLCEILRRDRTTAHVPIVVVTAEAREAERERARKAGADAFLVKPTSPDTILSEIERLTAHDIASREHAGPSRLDIPESTRAKVPRRAKLAKSHLRYTTRTPPSPPPDLTCPLCHRPLTYEGSYIGGVSEHHPEQWDSFTCGSCGAFEYRQRTRKLRRYPVRA